MKHNVKNAKKVLLLLMTLVLAGLLLGCAIGGESAGRSAPEEKGDDRVIAVKPGDFFPHAVGNLWEYEGFGNEYASFRREVLYAEGNRFQVKEDNGGAVSTAVFEVSEDAVVRVINRPESYEPANMLRNEDEEMTVILKAPLRPGVAWSQGDTRCEIVAVDATVDAPAGVFTGCLQIKKKENSDDVVFEYYKKGVGLVKREFISGDVTVTSVLKSYRVFDQ